MIRFDSIRQRLARWAWLARAVFLISACVAAFALIWREGENIFKALGAIQPHHAALALALSMGHIFASYLAWRVIIAGRDPQLTATNSARIFFLGQIGKYLPGGVWPFLASAEFGRDAGLKSRTTMASLFLALMANLGSGVILCLIALPQALDLLPTDPLWLLAAIAALAILLHPALLRKITSAAGIDLAPSPGRVFGAGILSVATWLFAGLHLIVLTRGIGVPLDATDLMLFTAIYAFAWIAGFLFMIAPAGLGAREATMIALLATIMPLAAAGGIALMSRLLMTLADFIFAGIILAITSRRPARGDS